MSASAPGSGGTGSRTPVTGPPSERKHDPAPFLCPPSIPPLPYLADKGCCPVQGVQCDFALTIPPSLHLESPLLGGTAPLHRVLDGTVLLPQSVDWKLHPRVVAPPGLGPRKNFPHYTRISRGTCANYPTPTQNLLLSRDRPRLLVLPAGRKSTLAPFFPLPS